MKHNVYVISAGRYDKLPFDKKQKEKYIFCVKNGEGKLYKENGCKNVYETGNLMKSRNFALLLGIPPTDNYFFANKIVSTNTFCIGDMLFIKPNELRFDEQLTLKEDYDYTLQHKERGDVIRYQKYLFTFEHYSNKGGAVDVRDDEEEQKNIQILKSKWGDKIKLNPKRKNEILI